MNCSTRQILVINPESLVKQVFARAIGVKNHYATITLEEVFRERTREMARVVGEEMT